MVLLLQDMTLFFSNQGKQVYVGDIYILGKHAICAREACLTRSHI